MEDDTSQAPDSLLPYDAWMEDSLRYVVLRALDHVLENGLPGNHHFYITFRTDFPGVQLPSRLLQKYPQEMTIVLQHQYRDLVVDTASRTFGVTLSFGGVPAALTIPLDAVTAFVDPSIQYGLRFRVDVPEPEAKPKPVEAEAEAAPSPPAEAAPAPQVVSLDAFRKRRE